MEARSEFEKERRAVWLDTQPDRKKERERERAGRGRMGRRQRGGNGEERGGCVGGKCTKTGRQTSRQTLHAETKTEADVSNAGLQIVQHEPVFRHRAY